MSNLPTVPGESGPGWSTWWSRIKAAYERGKGIVALDSRVRDLEAKLGDNRPSPYRKCPACAERDFRIQDRYRSRPEPFEGRYFHEKWLCFSCGHREAVNIPEPE